MVEIDSDGLSTRRLVWDEAVEMVRPVVEQHGLEGYMAGQIFTHQSTFTAVDQHIDHILRVANWLLGEKG